MKKFLTSALIALAAVAFVSCSKSDPGEVALAATQAVVDGGDLAQYVEPSATNKEAINKNNKEQAELSKQMGATFKDLKVVSVKEDGDKATVEISMAVTALGQTETSTEKIELKKVDGKWYIPASEFSDIK